MSEWAPVFNPLPVFARMVQTDTRTDKEGRGATAREPAMQCQAVAKQ